jgi:hypothetical protein
MSENLFEKIFDRAHREKQASRHARKFDESIFLVKGNSRIVAPSKGSAYGQASTERCGDHWIPGKLLRNIFRKICESDGVLRKRIVPRNFGATRRQGKGNRGVLLEILPRLFLKIDIQRLDAAIKRQPIMPGSERLDKEFGFLRRAGQLLPQRFFVPLGGRACCFGRGRRVQDRFYKNIPGGVVQCQKFEILVFVRPAFCLQLPSDSASRRTPLLFG